LPELGRLIACPKMALRERFPDFRPSVGFPVFTCIFSLSSPASFHLLFETPATAANFADALPRPTHAISLFAVLQLFSGSDRSALSVISIPAGRPFFSTLWTGTRFGTNAEVKALRASSPQILGQNGCWPATILLSLHNKFLSLNRVSWW